MLDSGIAKMGLFAFVFLIAFVGFITLMPSGLLANVKEYSNVNVPEYWFGSSLKVYNFTDYWNTTLNANDFQLVIFDVGDRSLAIQYNHAYYGSGNGEGWIRVYYRYGLGMWFHEDMQWFNSKEIRVSTYDSYAMAERFDDDKILSEYENGETVFKVVCLGKGGAWFLGSSSYFYVTAIFGFDETLYDNPLDAWNNDALNIFFGINPQNINYSKDVWFLLTSIMTFNTAEVFGSTESWALILNGIVCSFIYGAIVIFATAIALEVLPEWL